MTVFYGVWVFATFLLLLNGFAAGMAAALHAWRTQQLRRSRALMAAGLTGIVPVVMLLPELFRRTDMDATSSAGVLVVLAVVGGVTMAISLPGAVVIARKLDQAGDTYRTFE